MGFPSKWIHWIYSCVSSAAASVLVNGSPTQPIKLQKGLRQGDPLSPFLFNIIVEVLHLVVSKAVSLGMWDGIEVCPGGIKISHLQYADDTILFSPPNLEFLQNIKKSLILFQLASGLQVNFYKSSIMGLNVTDEWLDCAAKILLCKKGSLAFTYLGIPIGGSTSRLATWNPIISKIEKKLATWRGKLLSMGGRLTLIKSALSNLPLYFMSLFPVPRGIINKISALQRNFLWNGRPEKNSMPLIKWDSIQLPRKLGGLSVGNLFHRNLALLYKWVWRYFSDQSALWRYVIQNKYKYAQSFRVSDLQIPKSGGAWRNICAAILKNPEAKNLAITGIRAKIGDGKKVLFWHDAWLGASPLKNLFPRLSAISSSPNATIHSLGFWNGSNWAWYLSWMRNLRIRDSLERVALQKMLDKVCLALEEEDSFIWAPDKSGSFSVKSFSLELSKLAQPNHHDSTINIWKGLAPHRIELFVWLACFGKINTRGKLTRLGIISADQDICVLCNNSSETSTHLMLHCEFSWSVWCWWLDLWGIKWAAPPSLVAAYRQWMPPNLGVLFKKIWSSMFYIIIWSVWKERNSRVFNNIQCSQQQVRDLILTRLVWWMKGWGEIIPYSLDDILRNPQCLKWLERKKINLQGKPLGPDLSWAPPPPNSFKWNVDASFNPSINASAIGGVLRNSKGEFICIFSSPIPPMEINNAEVNAIFRAIQISESFPDKCQSSNLIIESDSLNAVKWCTAKEGGPWNLNFHLNFIRNAIKRNTTMSILHQKREANHVADSLAKQGLQRGSEFLAWM